MWRATLALVLVLSLGVVMAVPVAANVSQPTVTVAPALAATTAQYTIGFNINTSLAIAGTITVVFHSGTTVPTTYTAGDITVQGGNVAASGSGTTVEIVLAAAIAAPAAVEVIFTTAAGIENPTAGDKTLTVATSAETTPVTSATYTIIALPTVSAVAPVKGNVGDTMWVEVEGTNFTGTDTNNACTTTLNFGTGITVVSRKYIDTDEIDVQITINTAGAATVTALTAAGVSTTNGTFTANAAGLPQVDVWEAYDLTAVPFVTGSLIFDETTTTIQAAETASITGGTVIVHADTYVENLAIDQEITLQSLSGADTTIIDGGSGSVVDVTASNVTVDGFTIKGDGTTAAQRGLDLHKTGFTVENNKIIDVAHHNIYMAPTGHIASGLIDTNTITGLGINAEGAGIWVDASGYNIIGVEITDNTISNFKRRADGGMSAIELWERSGLDLDDMTITGNTISDSFSGIRINGSAGDGTVMVFDSNIISGHNMYDVSAGVTVGSGNPVFNMSNNTITDNVFGIELYESVATYTFKYNDISGNSLYGLLVPLDGATVNAKYNYWGDPSGPSSGSTIIDPDLWFVGQASSALGSGDAMSQYVDNWDPWLTETQAKTVTDGIAYFGSTMVLEPGWNTLSVPLKLKDSANTIAEIAALGDFLTDTNWEIAYQYNPALPGWENIGTSAIELVPGRGYYIKILGTDAVSFPVLYSGALGLPAYDLTTGWNLIGSAFGIDRTAADGDYGVAATTDDVGEGWMYPVDALDSIQTSGSVVISPSVPGQETNVWAATVSHTGTNKMYVGEAYWVFMIAEGTLAGFEVTPIYKVF